MKTTNRRNLFILVFALLVVMLGFGMVSSVFPFRIDKLGARGSTLIILVATTALTEFLFVSIRDTIFDINPNFSYLADSLILCAVFVMSLIWTKEPQPSLQVAKE